ncbi:MULTISPECIES: type III secretion system export apparatus subunit SctS [Edwardsiella]|uniref:Type III secretion system export apparatus subunit SctS n=1 Tax=Edwardsiella anguillarum TaxID=1821960 RepID=A0ABY8SF11_9GAMM|nr:MULTISPECIES: type III secretion system export apparatus subunit SctS [Edwardsiella]AJK93295.1 EscS [Edwardsiella sp. EA181011]GAJ68508.1 protein EscS [Edwardsiella piscicida]KAB0588213.1 EscS/YscS/HrcS family type III secretion system export apparatus protein [Edwardsiella anguillarum]MDA6076751.1 type III secretion system export apparatus subunit SctS [Edwardsiella anguillarum]RFT03406.1 EscS/YscS/HrcS family type III secretion system export apparatus protein [Edwardsiella anguillarum]
MNSGTLVQVSIEMLWVVLLLSLPTVAAASIVGILISLIQALTQLQDQTLPFLLKILAVFATLALTYHWMGNVILNFSSLIFEHLNLLVK